MAEVVHQNLTGLDAVHPASVVSATDPGAIGAHKFWTDTSTAAPYQLKKRNTANTAWENVGAQSSLSDPTTTRGDLIRRGVSALDRLAIGAVSTVLSANGTDPAWTATPTVTGELTALDLKATGMTGAANSVRLVGGTATGAPASGTFTERDAVVTTDGTIWICTVAGTPGTWEQVSGAGGGGGGTSVSQSTDAFSYTSIQGTGNKTTTSTTFVVIDNTNLPAKSIGLDTGDTVRIAFAGQISNTSTNATYIDVQVAQPSLGTTRVNSSTDGGFGVQQGTNRTQVTAITTFVAAEAGTHSFQVMWRTTAGTATLANATSGNDDTTIYFMVEKVAPVITLPYINIQDQKAQNTQGGTFTTGADRTRDLNIEVEDTHAIATLAANQITLPVGTYRCSIVVPCNACNFHQAWLYNATTASVVIRGTSEYAATGSHSYIRGRFTLSASSVLEVRHRASATRATDGFGTAANLGTEVYTVAEFWKED